MKRDGSVFTGGSQNSLLHSSKGWTDVGGHQECLLEPLMKYSFFKKAYFYTISFFIWEFFFLKRQKTIFQRNTHAHLKKRIENEKKKKKLSLEEKYHAGKED